MLPLRWLHLSDLHFKANDTWAQNVVLSAFLESIAASVQNGWTPDFILFSGDIAQSGREADYEGAAKALEKIREIAEVPNEKIFCVPGNHDITREINKYGIAGARLLLGDENEVDIMLGAPNELSLILKRQNNYRSFQREYFSEQKRFEPSNKLGYVSQINVRGMQIIILGLDSAWLSTGGADDVSRLLIGERQLIDTIKIADEISPNPHLTISMAHHPLNMLCEFDRLRVQNRIEERCNFFHHGHTHESDVRSIEKNTGKCIHVCAGSLYQNRHLKNSYYEVDVDVLHGECKIQERKLEKSTTKFTQGEEIKFDIRPPIPDRLDHDTLTNAIRDFDSDLCPWSNYMAELLLGNKSEMPVLLHDQLNFCAEAALEICDDKDVVKISRDFLSFRNILCAWYGRNSLDTIFQKYGAPISKYGELLGKICTQNETAKIRLAQLENDSSSFSARHNANGMTYSEQLLQEISNEGNSTELELFRKRYNDDSSDIANCELGREKKSYGLRDKIASAVDCAYDSCSADTRNIEARLNRVANEIKQGELEKAKGELLELMENYKKSTLGSIVELGKRIVERTGDRDLREKLRKLRERENGHE